MKLLLYVLKITEIMICKSLPYGIKSKNVKCTNVKVL